MFVRGELYLCLCESDCVYICERELRVFVNGTMFVLRRLCL